MLFSQSKNFVKNLLPQKLRSRFFLDELLSTPLVRSGIFQGMTYVKEAVGSALLAKLIGCYEKELESIFRNLSAKNVRVVFDIGAAEGYYAVGLARLLPDISLLAFEASEPGKDLSAVLAKANQVEGRIQILGTCTEELLLGCMRLHKPDFLLMDIEGGEIQLMTSRLVDLLADTEMLIEVHPFAAPGVVNILCEKTKSTHSVKAIHPVPRVYRDYWKSLSFLQRFFCGKTLLAYMGEGRGEESYWLHFSPSSQS